MGAVVTTWNLQGSRGIDIEAVARHLRRQHADVVLLQEIQRRQAHQLRWALGAQSLTWSFKHWPVRIPAEGMAIIGVTTPVTDVRARALSARWRFWSWRRRIVQTGVVAFVDGDDLALVNVHLSPHDSPARRERELERVLRHSSADAALVAGDFNDVPGSQLFGPLHERHFHDAGIDAGHTNWSGGRGTRAPNRRLDYVWVSAAFTVDRVGVPQFKDQGFAVYPRLSDHLPLTVELTPKRETPRRPA